MQKHVQFGENLTSLSQEVKGKSLWCLRAEEGREEQTGWLMALWKPHNCCQGGFHPCSRVISFAAAYAFSLGFLSPGHEDMCEYAERVCVLQEGWEDFRDRLSGIQILLCTLLCESCLPYLVWFQDTYLAWAFVRIKWDEVFMYRDWHLTAVPQMLISFPALDWSCV